MKKRIILSCILLVAVFIGLVHPISAFAAEGADIISPAIHVIARENSMAKATMRGQELSFDKNDFARALNVSRVSQITVTSLPDAEDGKLFLGSNVVNAGNTISGANLSLLTFKASSDKVDECSFCFSPEGAGYELMCNIYILDKANYAPTLSVASLASLNVSTYESITHFGRLSAFDPDGDELTFEVVSYPKKGVLVMTDRSSGEYKYIPTENYTGKDSFTYVAKDKYGNYSGAAEVMLDIDRLSISAVYGDMDNSRYHASALAMAEEGIMSGSVVGDEYYFYPEQTVSRAEFVVMAMRALGVSVPDGDAQTTFADSNDIMDPMLPYIAAAQKLGYVNGKEVDGKLVFLPNEAISRAEAAVIVSRMIESATPTVKPVFSDADQIPTWAEGAIYSLSSMGIIDAEGTEIQPTSLITREETAGMLHNMMSYLS